MQSKGKLIQTILPCPPVQKEEIDQLICGLLRICGDPDASITEVITVEKLTFICHKVVDVLKQSETLEYVHDPAGMAVIGDLHGSTIDLFQSINSVGWPTDRTLIFLGDYVDRGMMPMEVILFLFLLKIRYPKRVILLRGNHDAISMSLANQGIDGLIANIESFYPKENEHFLLNVICNVFDHLPLAAIISDQILCCHGGISQFVHSRSDISKIVRPPRWLTPHSNVFHVTIFTDILWADPDQHVEKYVPSKRGASYTFNRRALKEKLRQLNCRALIRGHETFNSGFTVNFDGLCYTIHSVGAVGDSRYIAATLLLDFDDDTKLVSGRVMYHTAGKGNLKNLTKSLTRKYLEVRHLFAMAPDESDELCSQCEYFTNGIPVVQSVWDRSLSHMDYKEIMDEMKLLHDEDLDFEFSWKDSTNVAYKAAREYPLFIQQMASSNSLLGCEQYGKPKIDDQQRYDFKFKLPQSDRNWPFLNIT